MDVSLLWVLCVVVEVSGTSWSLVQRSPTDCGASLCVIKKPCEWGGHGPRWVAEPRKQTNNRSYTLITGISPNWRFTLRINDDVCYSSVGPVQSLAFTTVQEHMLVCEMFWTLCCYLVAIWMSTLSQKHTSCWEMHLPLIPSHQPQHQHSTVVMHFSNKPILIVRLHTQCVRKVAVHLGYGT
jgi:hypothetical protein